jgi:hypothetical protein
MLPLTIATQFLRGIMEVGWTFTPQRASRKNLLIVVMKRRKRQNTLKVRMMRMILWSSTLRTFIGSSTPIWISAPELDSQSKLISILKISWRWEGWTAEFSLNFFKTRKIRPRKRKLEISNSALLEIRSWSLLHLARATSNLSKSQKVQRLGQSRERER